MMNFARKCITRGIAWLVVAALVVLASPLSAFAVNMLGERWFVRVYNVDDSAAIQVNGTRVTPWVGYRGDSAWVEITPYVNSTGPSTKIRCLCWNQQSGSAWGFKVGRQLPGGSLTTVWTKQAGTAGSVSADNRTATWVVDQTYSLGAMQPNRFGSPLSEFPVTQKYAAYGEVYAGKYHTGVDGGYNGRPVMAAASGTVKFSRDNQGKWGNVVVVEHNSDSTGVIHSQYAHLSKRTVAEGSWVNRGTVVGYVGGSGGWAPHLHFEIKKPNSGNGTILGPGYVVNQPNTYGFKDPLRFINQY